MFEQLREGVVLAQQNVGEGFVVAIRDVVARLEALDQIGFKQQRFGLRRRGDEQHLAGLRDHPGDTLGMPARFGVRRNPLLERFSLADVKHRPVGRQHAIDARPIGQRLHISLNPGHALQRHFGTVRRVGHRQSAKFSIFSRATLQAATSWVHSFSKFEGGGVTGPAAPGAWGPIPAGTGIPRTALQSTDRAPRSGFKTDDGRGEREQGLLSGGQRKQSLREWRACDRVLANITCGGGPGYNYIQCPKRIDQT